MLGRAGVNGDQRLAEGETDEQFIAFGPIGGTVDPSTVVPCGEVNRQPFAEDGDGKQDRLCDAALDGVNDG